MKIVQCVLLEEDDYTPQGRLKSKARMATLEARVVFDSTGKVIKNYWKPKAITARAEHATKVADCTSVQKRSYISEKQALHGQRYGVDIGKIIKSDLAEAERRVAAWMASGVRPLDIPPMPVSGAVTLPYHPATTFGYIGYHKGEVGIVKVKEESGTQRLWRIRHQTYPTQFYSREEGWTDNPLDMDTYTDKEKENPDYFPVVGEWVEIQPIEQNSEFVSK